MPHRVRVRSKGKQQAVTDSDNDNDSPATRSAIPAKVQHKEVRMSGFTENGTRFIVPNTHDTLHMLMQVWELPTIASLLCIAFSIFIALPGSFRGYPLLDAIGVTPFASELTIFLAIFWRLMYNAGIGLVLRFQSNHKFITRWVARLRANPNTMMSKFIGYMLNTSLKRNDALEKLPPEFNAWVLNTFFVNIILPNDVASFLLVCVKYFQTDSSCSGLFSFKSEFPGLCGLFHSLTYALALFLTAVSIYGKAASHKIIGHYAWFWGDFFFRLDQHLKFDGIFDIFPHPMYTVGYAWMYGLSLATGSYEVFALAMGSHISQMAFLCYVENPHIDKTYGVEFKKDKSTHKNNIFVIRNFDPFRSSDWLMLLICVFIVCLAYFAWDRPHSKELFLVVCVFCRLFATLFLGMFLRSQSRSRFWTKHFLEQGESREKAFEEWKRLCNAALTIPVLVFLVTCLKHANFPSFAEMVLSIWYYICALGFAMILFGVSAWSANESYAALGDFGWFYGDHFLTRPGSSSQVASGDGTGDHTDTGYDTEYENKRQDDIDARRKLFVETFVKESALTDDEGEGEVATPRSSAPPSPSKASKDFVDPQYVVRGIYRYVNHPDFVLGNLWYYGVALVCRSSDMAAVAVVGHICSWLLLVLVEEPHMQAIYDTQLRQDSSALSKAIKVSLMNRKHNFKEKSERLKDKSKAVTRKLRQHLGVFMRGRS